MSRLVKSRPNAGLNVAWLSVLLHDRLPRAGALFIHYSAIPSDPDLISNASNIRTDFLAGASATQPFIVV